MAELSERLNTPISTTELQRRWTAVRAAMQAQKIDVLLMQNNNDYMGGYVKYFTDMPATNGYPNTVVFPREDDMTVVCQGPFGGSETTASCPMALIWRCSSRPIRKRAGPFERPWTRTRARAWCCSWAGSSSARACRSSATSRRGCRR